MSWFKSKDVTHVVRERIWAGSIPESTKWNWDSFSAEFSCQPGSTQTMKWDMTYGGRAGA
jgi:hypothetical protein